jgi:hypothetical protein
MIMFEAFIQRDGDRAGPIFSTSDRGLAWDLAHVADRAIEASRGSGEVVLTMVDDGCVLDDLPDWKHPDFRRARCVVPIKGKKSV